MFFGSCGAAEAQKQEHLDAEKMANDLKELQERLKRESEEYERKKSALEQQNTGYIHKKRYVSSRFIREKIKN